MKNAILIAAIGASFAMSTAFAGAGAGAGARWTYRVMPERPTGRSWTRTS